MRRRLLAILDFEKARNVSDADGGRVSQVEEEDSKEDCEGRRKGGKFGGHWRIRVRVRRKRVN